MSSRDFNREMGSYLKQRRVYTRINPLDSARKYFKTLFTVKKAQKEEAPLDIPPEQVQAVIENSKVKAKTSVKAAPKAEQQDKPKRSGFMKWFSKQEEDFEEIEAQPVLDEDVKEVLKAMHKWIQRLDSDSLTEFKNSPDFSKYKALLDKYGLIKK